MKRRDFLITAAAVTAAPFALHAGEPTLYTPGLAEAAMDEGKVVFLDFWASWCGTCAAQHRVLAALKEENPAYEQNIAFFLIDWDDYSKGDLSIALNIPRRSTLVVLKGREEIGRIVAGTSKDDIKALLDTALAAV